VLAHASWHWTTDRASTLARVEWPVPGWATVAMLARWLAGVLIAGGAFWVFWQRWVAPELRRRRSHELKTSLGASSPD
jgi:hypothetical protein